MVGRRNRGLPAQRSAVQVMRAAKRAELLASLAHSVNDDEGTWDAIRRMWDTALAEYRRDTNADNSNTGLVDEWPATNAWRWAVIPAAELFGVCGGECGLRRNYLGVRLRPQ